MIKIFGIFFILFLFFFTSCPVLNYNDTRVFTKQDIYTEAHAYNTNIRISQNNDYHILTNYAIDTDGHYLDYLQGKVSDLTPQNKTNLLKRTSDIIGGNSIDITEANLNFIYLAGSPPLNIYFRQNISGNPELIGTTFASDIKTISNKDNFFLVYFIYNNDINYFYKNSNNWSTLNTLFTLSSSYSKSLNLLFKNNIIYAVFYNNGLLYFANSPLGGTISSQTLLDSYLAGNPIDLQEFNDYFYSSYVNQDSTYSETYLSIMEFDPDTPLTNRVIHAFIDPANRMITPSNMVIDRFGTIYIAYFIIKKTSPKAEWQLKLAIVDSDKWELKKTIDVDNGVSGEFAYDTSQPSLAVDSKGNIYITYLYINNQSANYGTLRLADTRTR